LMEGSRGFAEEQVSKCLEEGSRVAHKYTYIDA
jgi:hypothetical protein